MNQNNSTKKSPVPLLIAIAMILAVIVLKVLSSREENKGDPVFMFLGVLVVVGGFAAVIIYLSIKAVRRRRLEGAEYKKKSASDIAMYVFAGVGGAGLLAMLWSLCFTEKVNFLIILAEIAVFIAGFSVTYNIFMMKKKRGDYADKEESDDTGKDKGEQ